MPAIDLGSQEETSWTYLHLLCCKSRKPLDTPKDDTNKQIYTTLQYAFLQSHRIVSSNLQHELGLTSIRYTVNTWNYMN